MTSMQQQRSTSESPTHIAISAAQSPLSYTGPQSPQDTADVTQQILHKQHATPITATGISSRVLTLMPAPGQASQHSFRTGTSQTDSLAAAPPSLRTTQSMTSTMLPAQTQPASQQVANGPLSRNVIIPARAKPGRKAMDNSEKEDRRRKQNRNAQRNYRDRRSQQVAELSDEVNDLKQQSRDVYNQNIQEMQRLLSEQQQLRAEMQKTREETQRWMDKATYFERAYTQVVEALPKHERERFRELPAPQTQPSTQIMRAQAPLPDFSTIALPPLVTEEKIVDEAMPPTPPEDSPDETDFTQIWLQNRGVTASQPDSSNSNDDLTMSCGFCADSDYCPCREAAGEPAMPAPVSPVQTKTSGTGPGTCDMCQRDPARAEACRSLAGRTQPSTSPPVLKTDKTMNCGQFIDRANNNLGRMPSIAEILGPLHSYPAAKGFDINEQEAAVVLQHLSTQPSP